MTRTGAQHTVVATVMTAHTATTVSTIFIVRMALSDIIGEQGRV